VINMADRKIPQFQNESEEARWWFEHRDEIGSDLIAASRQGRSGEGSTARHARKTKEATKARSVQNDPSVQSSTQAKETHR
jgi:hypothetical protein